MAQIDVDALTNLLWAEGFEYEILEDEACQIGALRIYGTEVRLTIEELYPEADGWVLDPTVLRVEYRSGDPFWGSGDYQEIDIYEVETEAELFLLIDNVLLAEAAR
jgi:hypothetical protein